MYDPSLYISVYVGYEYILLSFHWSVPADGRNVVLESSPLFITPSTRIRCAGNEYLLHDRSVLSFVLLILCKIIKIIT